MLIGLQAENTSENGFYPATLPKPGCPWQHRTVESHDNFWRKVLVPFLRIYLGRTLYDDMARMEQIAQSSDLDWTIVLPAGLFDATEPTNDYEVSKRHLRGRFTSRADLAQVLIKEATEPQHRCATVEVVTRSGQPSQLTFLKEAFGARN